MNSTTHQRKNMIRVVILTILTLLLLAFVQNYTQAAAISVDAEADTVELVDIA